MNKPTTTRRALLAALPATAAAVAIPPAALALPNDRRDWEAAMRTYQHTEAEARSFSPVWDRVYDRWQKNRPDIDMIQWREFPHQDRQGVARSIDLDARWRHFLEGEGKWWWSREPEQRKAEYRAALDSVQAFRDAEAKHDRDSGMDAADARSEALTDAETAASAALMDMPAPDLAGLRWKLDYLTDRGEGWDGYSLDFVRQTLADIARLMPEAK